MHRKGAQTWRAIAAAAVLLFAAGQLVEQSHFHINADIDPLCSVCTHADGQDGAISAAPAQADESFDAVPAELRAFSIFPAQPRPEKQSRAPPHNLS